MKNKKFTKLKAMNGCLRMPKIVVIGIFIVSCDHAIAQQSVAIGQVSDQQKLIVPAVVGILTAILSSYLSHLLTLKREKRKQIRAGYDDMQNMLSLIHSIDDLTQKRNVLIKQRDKLEEEYKKGKIEGLKLSGEKMTRLYDEKSELDIQIMDVTSQLEKQAEELDRLKGSIPKTSEENKWTIEAIHAYQEKRYVEAMQLFEKANKRVFDQAAQAHHVLGSWAKVKMDEDLAFHHFDLAVRLQSENITFLESLVDQASEVAQYNRELEICQLYLDIVIKKSGKKSHATAEVLRKLSVSQCHWSQFENAHSSLTECEQLFHELGDCSSLEYVRMLGTKCYLLSITSQLKEAIEVGEKALAIYEEQQYEEPQVKGKVAWSLGRSFYDFALYDKAFHYWEMAKECFLKKEGINSLNAAAAFIGASMSLQKLDRWAEAARYIDESLRIQRIHNRQDHHHYCYALRESASIDSHYGRFIDAYGKLQEAEIIVERIHGQKSHEFAEIKRAIGHTLLEDGKPEQGRQNYAVAMKIIADLSGQDSLFVGHGNAEIASSYLRQEMHKDAIPFLEEAVRIYALVLGNAHDLTIERRQLLEDAKNKGF